jgi:hypothetical protein
LLSTNCNIEPLFIPKSRNNNNKSSSSESMRPTHFLTHDWHSLFYV